MKSLVCTTLLVETSPQGLPLGAACIASSIKADSRTKNGFSVSLADFSLEDKDIMQARKNGGDEGVSALLAEKLASKKPDFVCFSVYVWNRRILEGTCRRLKKLLPDCLCIAGGPEVTADPLSFDSFDFMIAGQGERAMVELLDAMAKSKAGITGIGGNCNETGRAFGVQGVYRTENSLSAPSPQPAGHNEIVRACPLPPEMTASPYLDGTLDPSKYGGALWELARGCPFKCSYCYESKGEKKIAYFPMERLEKEIELFAKKKIAQVFVLDPTYNASKERAIKMLKIIEKKAPGTFFYFEARAEFIDRELARAFARIPCCLQIGLQSANPEVLKNVHRTLEKKRFEKNIGFLNEEGVTFGFDLIYGLPGDNFKGFCESIDFALSLYPNNLELFCLSVLPGTDLHDAAKGFGMEWESQPPYHVLRTPQFSEKDLAKAERLSLATNLFYTKGRAVAWFNSVIYVLREKPSDFLKKFEEWLGNDKKTLASTGSIRDWTADENSAQIEELQLAFIQKRFHEKGLDRFLPATEDLIRMHAALGRCTFDGTESTFTTRYHPDDVMSEYGTDIEFFTENCGKQKCRVKVFVGKNGADWKTL
ncbi:MAG: radical SAM protein [Treponema sp.]|uniref:B12-binding domain-containing radical SAM protein n=1 Tax=Treponema sp. TaxID=166 RepID=UPI0025FB5C41|nr:B12-binding domain-containing radical SAM protein [Treponema sp.]MBQ8680287.1 radical SAM protein [Treponema sp.]